MAPLHDSSPKLVIGHWRHLSVVYTSAPTGLVQTQKKLILITRENSQKTWIVRNTLALDDGCLGFDSPTGHEKVLRLYTKPTQSFYVKPF